MSTYATARADVAAALVAEFGSTYTIHDHPPDRITRSTMAIAAGPADALNRCMWRRELAVAVFHPRNTMRESSDELDKVATRIRDTIEAIPGAVYGGDDRPEVVTIGDVEYLAQLHTLTIETGN